MVRRLIDEWGGVMDGSDKKDLNDNFAELYTMYSPFTAVSAIGGFMVKLTNKTGAASVKGKIVDAARDTDNAVRLTQVDVPDTIGVMFEDGVADGQETWIVISGIAEVYFSASVTRGWLARSTITADGVAAGIALGEAVPASPFATDKHFCEIGHILASRTGAGLAKTILHFN